VLLLKFELTVSLGGHHHWQAASLWLALDSYNRHGYRPPLLV